VPDIAAWRIDRYPDTTKDPAFVTVPPDWVAEILSTSTARLDRGTKLPLYAREGVTWAWLVDADIEVIEVYRLDPPRWTLHGTLAGRDPVRAPPFDAIELDLDWIWGDTPR